MSVKEKAKRVPAAAPLSQKISAVLVAGNDLPQLNNMLGKIMSVFSSNRNLELIMVCNGAENIASVIQGNKLFQELAAGERGKLVNIPLTVHSKAVSAGVKASSGDFVILLDESNYHHLQLFLSQVTKSSVQDQFDKEKVIVGCPPPTASKNLGFMVRLLLFFHNLIYKLATGIHLPGIYTSVIMMPRAAALMLPEGSSVKAGSFNKNMLYRARLFGYELVPVMLNADLRATTTMQVIKSVFSVFSTAVTVRWYWFFTLPVKLLSGKPEHREELVSRKSNRYYTYRLAFLVLALLTIIGMPYLSFSFGITWDEKIQNTYAADMLNYFLTFGKDKSCLDTNKRLYNTMIYYGSFFDLFARVFYKLTGWWGEFETRHFLNAIFGAVAIFYTGMIGREFGNWRIGVLAFFFILITPGFFGHSMNNPKDVPFTTAYVFSLYQLIRFLKQLPKPKTATMIYLVLGIALAISIRIGGVLLIAYLAMFMFLKWVAITRAEGFNVSGKLLRPFFVKFVLIAAGGYALGILFWPYALQNPIKNPYLALQNFSDFSSLLYTYELFDGQRTYMAQLPWTYLPKSMLIGIPVVIWAGVALCVLLCWRLWKKHDLFFIGLLLFVLVFPPFYAIYKHSMLYNGWRHFLFISPLIAVTAAIGWDALAGLMRNKIYQAAIVCITLVCAAGPVFWMIRNHPNQYVYFNELQGGIKGAYGFYELDYYSNSCREAAEWLAGHEKGKKIVAINNEPLTASYYGNQINPDLAFTWVRDYEEDRTMWDYAIYTTRTYSQNELLHGSYPPKGTIYEVKAGGVPIAVVVKRESYDMPSGYKALDARQYDSAYYYFSKAAEWNNRSEEAFRMKGVALMSLERADEALQELQKSIDIFPENYIAYCNMGQVYMNLKRDPDKALEYFKKSAGYKINYIEAYYYAGVTEFSRNNYMAGIPYMENAVKYGGNIPEVYYNLGIAYANTASYAKAEEALLACLSLNERMVNVYPLLSQVYSKMGKSREAELCMQKYRELGGQ